MSDQAPQPPASAWRAGLPSTFVLGVTFTVFTVGGLVVAFTVFPSEWSFVRKVLGGLLTGYGSAFCLFANHLLFGE